MVKGQALSKSVFLLIGKVGSEMMRCFLVLELNICKGIMSQVQIN